MKKLALTLSYVGTRYHGWQRQKEFDTIQERIESAVKSVTGQTVSVSGCGRTDAGVHAKNYVASLFLDTAIPPEKLPRALNAYLPPDISVHNACVCEDGFDARFSCKYKEYTYTIHNSRTRDPFLRDFAYYVPAPLNYEAMKEAAPLFCGTRDFAAVRTMGTPVKSTVRTVYACETEKSGDVIRIRTSADGFLYNMARAIAGTLLYVGLSKMTPQEADAALESGIRANAGPVLPACGLCLTEVKYRES